MALLQGLISWPTFQSFDIIVNISPSLAPLSLFRLTYTFLTSLLTSHEFSPRCARDINVAKEVRLCVFICCLLQSIPESPDQAKPSQGMPSQAEEKRIARKPEALAVSPRLFSLFSIRADQPTNPPTDRLTLKRHLSYLPLK